MTDRVNALTVVLTEDIRADDVEPLIDAVRMLRGVASVTTNVSDLTDHIAQQRAEQKIRGAVLAAVGLT